jgi:hypothetical protein
MKKIFALILFSFSLYFANAQEILANVIVNAQQIGGSNKQVYQTLEKSLKNFINNTSWTGKKLQNFEKIKCNFAIVVSGVEGSNLYHASIVVQAVRPIFGSVYESPLLNINDTSFDFKYTENENLTFNERQFSGNNLTDVISFYIYLVLGYDGDSFQLSGGQEWLEKAQKISQNAQNNGFSGWSSMEGVRTRGGLIDNLLKEQSNTLRNTFYSYHRVGLDNLGKQDQNSAKQLISDTLMQLKYYEDDYAMNYPLSIFIDAKKDEIFNIFNSNNNGSVNINDLKNLMSLIDPKDIDGKWSRWK